jgi:hypothetical protein
MDLGMAVQLDNGHGAGNEHGVLTDNVQAVDRGRRRGFVSARRSDAVVLGYRREGEGGTTPFLGLRRLSCDLYGGDMGVWRSASG